MSKSVTQAVPFRIAPELHAALRAIKDRDGIPISEQMRRALRLWFEDRKIAVVSAPAGRRRRG